MVANRSKAWAIALLLLLSGIVRAQEYSFRNFGSADGLSNLSIRSIFQDRAGFLWVATVNGIYRYDGERFEAFGAAQGIPSTPNTSFGDAPDGSLLAGGSFGLLRLRGSRFERVPGPFKSVGELQGIQSDGKGHTYINTEHGLMVLTSAVGKDGFAIRAIPHPADTQETSTNGVPDAGGVLVDGEAVWYGCGQRLCRLEKGETRSDGPENNLPARLAVAIRKDREGNLWVRLRSEGILELLAGEHQFRRPVSQIPGQVLAGIPAVDASGRTLLPMPDGLLIKDGQQWQKIDHTSGLRGAAYTAFEDRQHSLWIGMTGRGLVQWRGYQEWENYTPSSGLPSDGVNEILLQKNGLLWVGTDGGLLRGERQSVGVRWKKAEGFEGISVHAVRSAEDGTLWLGTELHGVARMDVRSGKVKWYGDAQGLTRGAFELRFDRQRRLWVGTDMGLFVATAPYERFTHIAELPNLRVRAIAEGTDGTIWVGGIGGLYSFRGEQWKNWTQANGLRDTQVLSLGVGTRGTIWVGYRFRAGIDQIRLQQNGLTVEKNFGNPSSNGIVYFMESDLQGRLWAGTDHGVDVWDGARWSHYEMNDGLVWDNCSPNSFAAEPDGTVWIGTSGGLSHFSPRLRHTLEEPIEVVFTRLQMGGMDVSNLANPSFDIHNNSLVARYSALNATRENAVVFRYRMEGDSSAWTETTHRELQFANLAPGNYKLEVEAQDGNGLWRAHRAEFAFRVRTPWYRAWWFILLCALIPLGGTLGLLRIRMAAAKRREHELQLLVEAQKTIQNLAFYDPLTELPNRRMLLDRLRKTLASSTRSGRLCALLFVDLDRFKNLNDSFGHQTGDLILQETARRLSASTRETDTVARLGGDEFVIILEDLGTQPKEAATQAEKIAEKILAAISLPYLLGEHDCLLTASVGITIFGIEPESTEEVLQQADIAMYQAKAAGRNAVRFYAPELQAAINARASMEEEMRIAIKQNQFLLYYQPQVDSGKVIGAEALVRWMHPQLGILFPDTFIPLAEETGMILPLGEWVLETACRQLDAWATRSETAHLSIAVNISARQLRMPDFVDRVVAVIEQTGANPHNIELELTESMLVDNFEDVIQKMSELKLYGLKFSLDDFGTGYSSLSYLRRLPLDRLKIDRAFVKDILTDTCGGAIAQAIISLSRAMNMPVLAEGVETVEQMEFLAKLGCHTYQGYLFSRPVPLGEFEELLAKPESVLRAAAVEAS